MQNRIVLLANTAFKEKNAEWTPESPGNLMEV